MAAPLKANDQSYRARYGAWVSGVCPYCGKMSVRGTISRSCSSYHCTSCGAENKFTNPNVIGVKKK